LEDYSALQPNRLQENIEDKNPTDHQPSNRIIESIVINSIYERHNNVSGCFSCNANLCEIILQEDRNIVEVVCNGLLPCSFCEIAAGFESALLPEDFVIVQCAESLEIAQIKMVGELVKIKRHYLGLYGEDLPKIVRKASEEDLEKTRKNLFDEERAVSIFKRAADKYKLTMKLVSIHYQFDRKKLFFFYTADGRVDFRELAKDLAGEFKTRIELRQIGVRDEAKKIGGAGACGREYCCISFLSSFKRITTQLATEQNLLSSMGKISGPCGKLKCCLSFEAD
jgi:cell fate regulator YaaT (PSP1 superfamily)